MTHNNFVCSLFFKGFIFIAKQLQTNMPNTTLVMKALESASDGFYYKPPRSSQYYQVVKLYYII